MSCLQRIAVLLQFSVVWFKKCLLSLLLDLSITTNFSCKYNVKKWLSVPNL